MGWGRIFGRHRWVRVWLGGGGGEDVRISRTCTHGEVDPDIYMMGNNGRFAGWKIFGSSNTYKDSTPKGIKGRFVVIDLSISCCLQCKRTPAIRDERILDKEKRGAPFYRTMTKLPPQRNWYSSHSSLFGGGRGLSFWPRMTYCCITGPQFASVELKKK